MDAATFCSLPLASRNRFPEFQTVMTHVLSFTIQKVSYQYIIYQLVKILKNNF